MPRTLKLEKGKLVDVEKLPHQVFKGVASRDLEVGDTFEEMNHEMKKTVVMKTIEKNVTEDGCTVIVSGSV